MIKLPTSLYKSVLGYCFASSTEYLYDRAAICYSYTKYLYRKPLGDNSNTLHIRRWYIPIPRIKPDKVASAYRKENIKFGVVK